MARNIPGIGDSQPFQNAENDFQGTQKPGQSQNASSENSNWDNFTRGLDTGNEAMLRKNINPSDVNMKRRFAEVMQDGELRIRSLKEQEKENNVLIKHEEIKLKMSQQIYAQMQTSGKFSAKVLQQHKDDIVTSQNELALYKQKNTEIQKKTQSEENFQIKRRAAESAYFGNSERVQRELGRIEERRQKTFLYNLGQQDFQIRKATQNWGMGRIKDNAPLWLGGSGANQAEGAGLMSRGAGAMMGMMALAGAAIAGALISKFTELFQKSVNQTIAYGDLSKGVVPGQRGDGYDLMTRMRKKTDGFGLSTDEVLELAKSFRPYFNARNSDHTAFENQVSRGISMGRAFGIDPSKSVEFLGQMVRKSAFTSTPDTNRLAYTIGAEIGNGRLAGLEEEALSSIKELVEITRKGAAYGSDPTMAAKLIGNISGLENGNLKGMRGEDATRLLAQINESLVHPKTTMGNQLRYMAVSETLKQMGAGNLANDASMLIRYGGMGLGMTVNGQAAGMGLLKNMANMYKRFAPGYADIAFSNETGLPTQIAAKFLQHSDEITGGAKGSFAEAAGLDKGEMSGKFAASPAGIRFMMAASEIFKENGGKKSNETLSAAIDRLAETMPEADKLKAAFKEDKSFDENLGSIAEAASKLKNVNAQDEMREGIKSIDRLLQRLTDATIPAFQVITGWLTRLARKYLGEGNFEDDDFARSQIEEGRAAQRDARDKANKEEQSANILTNGEKGTDTDFLLEVEHRKRGSFKEHLADIEGANGSKDGLLNIGALNDTLALSDGENKQGWSTKDSSAANLLFAYAKRHPEMKGNSIFRNLFRWEGNTPFKSDDIFEGSAVKLWNLRYEIAKQGTEYNRDMKAILGVSDSETIQREHFENNYLSGARSVASRTTGDSKNRQMVLAALLTEHLGYGNNKKSDLIDRWKKENERRGGEWSDTEKADYWLSMWEAGMGSSNKHMNGKTDSGAGRNHDLAKKWFAGMTGSIPESQTEAGKHGGWEFGTGGGLKAGQMSQVDRERLVAQIIQSTNGGGVGKVEQTLNVQVTNPDGTKQNVKHTTTIPMDGVKRTEKIKGTPNIATGGK